MTEYDLTTDARGRIIWADSCRECGAPTTPNVSALFVAECLICNLPGCNLCMPRGNKTPCNECIKLLEEDTEYG